MLGGQLITNGIQHRPPFWVRWPVYEALMKLSSVYCGKTYVMAEIVVAASEFAAECLHLWPEVGWMDG
jgi:hypothetical protein